MKLKLFTMALLCAIGTTAYSQTEKGRSLIGGSLGYSTYNDQQENFSTDGDNVYISPTFGHFVANNFVVGLKLSYIRSHATNIQNTLTAINGSYNNTLYARTGVTTTFSGGPMLRYYVDINEKFKFFGQFDASIGISRGKTTESTNYPTTPPKSKTIYYDAAIRPGFALLPSKKWAIELGFNLISYGKVNSKYGEDQTKQENFSFGFSSFSPSIGVNFHF